MKRSGKKPRRSIFSMNSIRNSGTSSRNTCSTARIARWTYAPQPCSWNKARSRSLNRQPRLQPGKSAAASAKPGWFAWFRPALAVPVFALLLAAIGYQNFVTYPKLIQAANQPQVGPWASVNISTRGATTTVIKARAGEGFGLLVNLPPEDGFASYTADLYNPAEKLDWSGPISAASEGRQIYIPGRDRRAGTYTLVVHGITSAGESKEISRHPIDVQIQK